MRSLTLLLCVVALPLAAQQPATAPQDSVRAESAVAPLVPNAAQTKYLRGLQTAGRGVSQLKQGVNRVAGAGRDSTRLAQAGRMLGGFCGSARGFLVTGRGKMQANVFDDSTAVRAKRLAAQIDTLIRFAPSCEAKAAKQTDSTAAHLFLELRAYEAALKDFRGAIGLPTK